MATRSNLSWRHSALVGLLTVAAVAWGLPTASAHADILDLHEDPLHGTDAQTSPFAPRISFVMPEQSVQPRFSVSRDDYEYVPVMHVMPWTYFAVTASNPPFSDALHGGFLAEIGVEFGSPIFHVGGTHLMITAAPAIGGQVYAGDTRDHGAFHFALNSLMGVAFGNHDGTSVFQMGLMLRGEFAFKRLRYETGENILGIDGIGAFSAGMFMRWSFLLGWDLAGSAALFILYDVTDGRREWMVGVDLGGLIIAALLGVFSDR